MPTRSASRSGCPPLAGDCRSDAAGRTGELAFYRRYSPEMVPLREMVRVAGGRWAVEEPSQTANGLATLDPHQVRRCTSEQR